MTRVGLCSTSDVITFDQSCHLYSSFAGVTHLSNDTQMRVIFSMEPEIRIKMLRNMIENHAAKFSANTLSNSVVKIARLNDAVQ